MAAVTRAAAAVACACVPPRVRPRRVRLALARGTATAAAILSGNDKNNEPKRQRRRRHTSPMDMYLTGWMMLYDEGVANKSTFRIVWKGSRTTTKGGVPHFSASSAIWGCLIGLP